MAEIRTDGLVDRERLRATLTLLRTAGPGGVTKAQLAKRLGGVCTRTVDRALQLLEDQGARLLRERKGRPSVLRFQLERGPAWDEQVSSRSRALLRGLGAAAAQPGLAAWPALLDMAQQFCGEDLVERERRSLAFLRNMAPKETGSGEALEALLRALEGGRLVEAQFAGRTRTLHPLALLPDQLRGGTLLMALEGVREETVFLPLASLKGLKPLGRAPEPRHPEAIAAAARFQIGGHHLPQPDFAVKVRVAEALVPLPGLPELVPGKGRSAQELNFRATDPEGVLRWAIRNEAEILEPAALKKALKARLEALAKR